MYSVFSYTCIGATSELDNRRKEEGKRMHISWCSITLGFRIVFLTIYEKNCNSRCNYCLSVLQGSDVFRHYFPSFLPV